VPASGTQRTQPPGPTQPADPAVLNERGSTHTFSWQAEYVAEWQSESDVHCAVLLSSKSEQAAELAVAVIANPA